MEQAATSSASLTRFRWGRRPTAVGTVTACQSSGSGRGVGRPKLSDERCGTKCVVAQTFYLRSIVGFESAYVKQVSCMHVDFGDRRLELWTNLEGPPPEACQRFKRSGVMGDAINFDLLVGQRLEDLILVQDCFAECPFGRGTIGCELRDEARSARRLRRKLRLKPFLFGDGCVTLTLQAGAHLRPLAL